MNSLSAWEQRRRKALLVLPVLVVPFITLGFWALGGASSSQADENSAAGMNLSLPQTTGKKEVGLDKLRFYEAADQDSMEWRRKLTQDRYSMGLSEDPVSITNGDNNAYDPAPPISEQNHAATERLIYQRLGAINRQVSEAEHDRSSKELLDAKELPVQASMGTSVRFAPKEAEPEADKELSELNQMMDKILDIQHPDRAKARQQQVDTPANYSKSQAVSSKPDIRIAYFGVNKALNKPDDHFYIPKVAQGLEKQEPGLVAIIHNQQEVLDGSVVQFRLLQTFYLNGVAVPAGTMVHGTASIRGDRLQVAVTSIVLQDKLYPAVFKVYDLDGMEGLRIPGSLVRNTINESVENSFQSLSMLSMDPSLRGQAAAAGIQAVKSLAGKKARQVRVVLPSGYQVLLKQSK
ncbi:Bacteroides conjugative transposon TraM protein [Cnuella takakiae]|uniref:Bacteroides conjugative transposon TraM protein n=1 Tax=Cnuella takakiae TaxID=1302690 RepID=A0A1M4ZGJ5_9BACT|nr:conjugative transposon protein TraM [Cnuella takakiae]OLY94215.1 conjugative transposon protein TraM [Cnuella takakiae]SHF17131.1 Bacteroides conjugative transposon TraM protein [Cnuella takakiae]